MNMESLKTVLLVIVLLKRVHSFDCDKLPNGCRFAETFDQYGRRFERFICDRLDKTFDFDEAKLKDCKMNASSITEIFFRLDKPEILDSSFNIPSMDRFLREMNKQRDESGIKFTYLNLKGFELNTPSLAQYVIKSPKNSLVNYSYDIQIYESSMDFYVNSIESNSCDDFLKWNLTEPKTFFQIKSEIRGVTIDITFIGTQFSEKHICPFYFHNMSFNSLNIRYQINTFYKKNFLKFDKIPSNYSIFLNPKIKSMFAYNIEKIDIDSTSFLNKHVFKNLNVLALFGDINYIEKDIFKDFNQLKNIFFNTIYFEKLIRKGTKWISYINYGLHVNLNNKSDIDLNINKIKMINLNFYTIMNLEMEEILLFPNEDICLFEDFPFDQLVIFSFGHLYELFEAHNVSCTFQWLMKYYDLLAQNKDLSENYFFKIPYFHYSNAKNSRKKFETCDFEKLISNCDKGNFQINKNIRSMDDIKEISYFAEYILIVSLPVFCFLGILTNSLIIFTLSIKDNKTDLNKKHYHYLRLVSVINIVVLAINLLSPIYECQRFDRAYCSRFYKFTFIQYYKIIFGEFFNSVFKLISNFLYVGFSICRLSLIGKDHSKFIKFISDVSIRTFIIGSCVISVALSTVKIFHYQVNTFNPQQDYPIPYDQNYNNVYSPNYDIYARLVNVFNAIADLSTYFVFVLINLILDVVLVVKLKRTLADKLNSDNVKNSEIVFRIISLVIAFTIFSFVLKLPASVKSIFDSIHLNNNSNNPIANSHIDHLYDKYCIASRYCTAFDKFSSILYVISISANILFYFLFDKQFKIGLKIALSKIISDKEEHCEYITVLNTASGTATKSTSK